MEEELMDNILYEQVYYLIKETKKPTYLDFYDLDDADLKMIECYLEQTIRYKNRWYFITTKKQYFSNAEKRDTAPKIYLKNLYKKPIPIKEDK